MFEDNLKELRKKKGVTQEELAKSIYVSRSLIAKFETGTSYPNNETLKKIAIYFNVKVSDLIDNDESTLMAIESKNIATRINFWATILVLIIMILSSIILFIPLLKGSRYVYPIPPTHTFPNKETFYTSIFSATTKNNNPIGLVLLILNLTVIILGCMSLIFKKKKYQPFFNLFTYVFSFIDIFVFFIAIICSLSLYFIENTNR